MIPGFVFTGLTAKGRTEKPAGAWTPEQTVDFMIERIDAGDFYILCPDNDVPRCLDQRRILWAAGDIVENRPALSRWHPAYAEAAIGRVRATRPMPEDGLAGAISKRDAPRVPFGSLVERGVIAAGTRLYDRMRRVSAMVTADGTIVASGFRGSIHKVGATVQNAPSCNGWTFWHFERDGRLVPLDELRAVALD